MSTPNTYSSTTRISLRREAAAAAAIAARDVTKLLRDPIRLVGGLVFPALFIGVLGGAFASNFKSPGKNPPPLRAAASNPLAEPPSHICSAVNVARRRSVAV
jgi:hypothetical protein